MVFAIHWHESAMDLHMLAILNPSPTSLPIPSLWDIPVQQPWSLVSCIHLRAFLPFPPTLHLFLLLFCFCLLSLSLSLCPSSPSPALLLSYLPLSLSLYLSLSSLSLLLWVPLYSLSLIFFHSSVFTSPPHPFLSEPHLTEALLYLPVCLTQLSSKKPPTSFMFLQSQAVASVVADTGELDLSKIIFVLKKLEETLGPATSLQKGGSDISVSFRPQLEPLYGSEPDRFRNESLTLKKPCLLASSTMVTLYTCLDTTPPFWNLLQFWPHPYSRRAWCLFLKEHREAQYCWSLQSNMTTWVGNGRRSQRIRLER